MPFSQPPRDPPSCWRCRHLAISYDVRLPYLCRNMQIKTRALPSEEVYRASGQECRGFDPKPSQSAGR